MKRISSIIAAAALFIGLIGITGYAGDSAGIEAKMDYDIRTVNISYDGNVSYKTKVMFYLLEETQQFSDAGSALRIASADYTPGSQITLSMKIGNSLEGRYRIYAVAGGKSYADTAVYSDGFFIADQNSETLLLQKINSAEIGQLARTVFENTKDILNLKEDSAPEWKSDYLFAMRSEDFSGGFKNLSQVERAWYAADVLKTLAETSAEGLPAVLEENQGSISVDLQEADYLAYGKAVCELIENMEKENRAYSVKWFSRLYQEALALATVNECGVNALPDAFEKYQDVLGISGYMTRYAKFDSLKFARQFDGVHADSVEKIKEKFEEVLAQFEREQNNNAYFGGGSGGGITGGSSSGSGSTISMAAQTDAEIQNETGEAQYRFTDVREKDWAYDYIIALSDKGILKGYEDGTFRPEKTILREEFAKIIVEALGLSVDGLSQEQRFEDVSQESWCYPYVMAAVECGVVKGNGENWFGMGENISREDMAVMIVRAMEFTGKTLETDVQADFTDAAAIADYAETAVAKLCKKGIVNGFQDGSFGPEKALTRAEAAKIIYKVLITE